MADSTARASLIQISRGMAVGHQPETLFALAQIGEVSPHLHEEYRRKNPMSTQSLRPQEWQAVSIRESIGRMLCQRPGSGFRKITVPAGTAVSGIFHRFNCRKSTWSARCTARGNRNVLRSLSPDRTRAAIRPALHALVGEIIVVPAHRPEAQCSISARNMLEPSQLSQ